MVKDQRKKWKIDPLSHTYTSNIAKIKDIAVIVLD